jgi:mycothiol synthase
MSVGRTVVPIAPGDEAGIGAYLSIRNAVTPDLPDSLDQVRWEDATYPGTASRFLALVDGRPAGTGTTGRIWMHEASYERFWLGLWVLAADRGSGLGSALYRAVSGAARAAGKTGFQTELSESHVDGHRFLGRRGFVETERTKLVRLDLHGVTRPAPALPPGIALVTLADRPDLVEGVHDIARETFADIPTGDAPVSVGTLEEFRARDVDRTGIPHDAYFVALDEATGDAAGYACLVFDAGSTTVALHDMTAVRRAYRGRGIATTLKLATIAWAIDHGLEALETGNDETNAAMRAVNARLGYRPIPDLVGLHGPLAPEG